MARVIMNEKYNTFNALKSEPLLVRSIWCYLGLHNWQKWSDHKETNQPGFSSIKHVIQETKCNNCNLYKYREIE